MFIHTIYGARYDSNIFILQDESHSAIVDTGTGAHSSRVLKAIEKFVPLSSVRQIVLTHRHYDHTGGVKSIMKSCQPQPEIMIHESDALIVEKGEDETASAFGGRQEPIIIDRKLRDGDVIVLGATRLEVLHTPGHTEGSICLYERETKTLISGDTVFANGSTGRWDLTGGDYQLLLNSLKRLSEFDVENLYPGHGYIVRENGDEHIRMALEFLEEFS